MDDDPTAVIDSLLTVPGRWAVVGLSTNARRAAHGVAAYLQALGHEIVPVHPRAEAVHGAQGYPRLTDVPGRIDVVDVFVNSQRAGSVIDEAIAIGARAVWLQLGVHDPQAEERALLAGLAVITDTCPKIEGGTRGLAAGTRRASGDQS
ncbi:CoA-binding protein [Actinotalea sp. K2]|uniref:CoA-binding protein n=1 Tax=Actinotalea sp. K2 TaxID=2939438 RepID=UPI002017748B|nr:CoA-binding protein [Actinotalea sp. K2]MCL3860698.1 CoA-binding protein [Actinotalea sp. K2]